MDRLCVVVLTRNERANLPRCLDALVSEGVEVVVVDAASDDGTAEAARVYAAGCSNVRVHASARRLAVGEARDVGVAMAGPRSAVGFVSADAVVAPGWGAAARVALERADVVYGPQRHAPERRTVAAAVRGLRYHHFERGLSAGAFASHVNAVLSPRALAGWSFAGSDAASALDDVLFARAASSRGLRVAFEPGMLVLHRDVETFGQEWRKVRREGRGWGALRRRVGVRRDVLAWGAATAAAGAGAFVAPVFAPVAAGVVWAPAARRLTRSAFSRYGAGRVAAAVAVSPVFDLAFLASYLEGWVKPE